VKQIRLQEHVIMLASSYHWVCWNVWIFWL